jgi:TolB-like protein
MVGTVAYMSPEQVRARELDSRTDLFSFGSVLYEMVTGDVPFHGESSAVICEAIMNRTPVPAVRLNHEIPTRLEDIINKALEKDRNLRYQHASEMRSDLQRLKRDTDTGRIPSPGANAGEVSASSTVAASSGQHSAASSGGVIEPQAQKRPSAKNIGLAVAAVAILLLALAAFFWQSKHRIGPAAGAGANQTTVAVLPFQNMGAEKDADFLQLALPDEIATALSYVHSLSIRPFATTSKYTAAGLDLQQAGREMRVSDIVTGHYMKQGNQLQITLEAVDVENNRTLWRDTLNVAAPDMIAMRGQIDAKVRQGLVPSLGAGTDSGDTSTRPKNEEAYDLYLRSLALPHDPGPNKEGIAMLERAVGLDPSYAPAWGNLGRRYYLDSQYGGGGEASFQKSNTALDRALALDPNFTLTLGQLVANLSERAQLGKAYKTANDWTKRQSGNAMAHFVKSYVLRYGGMLDESVRECETALSLDSGNYIFRACVFTFEQSGNEDRAMDFLRLDAGSSWYNANVVRLFWRAGKMAEAREAIQKEDQVSADEKRFKLACTDRSSLPATALAELDRAAHKIAPEFMSNPDPENRYLWATDMAFCGEKDVALRLLKSSIEGRYCVYDAMQKDPLMASLRSTPEYPQLLSAAQQCKQAFIAERARVSPE